MEETLIGKKEWKVGRGAVGWVRSGICRQRCQESSASFMILGDGLFLIGIIYFIVGVFVSNGECICVCSVEGYM